MNDELYAKDEKQLYKEDFEFIKYKWIFVYERKNTIDDIRYCLIDNSKYDLLESKEDITNEQK